MSAPTERETHVIGVLDTIGANVPARSELASDHSAIWLEGYRAGVACARRILAEEIRLDALDEGYVAVPGVRC